MPQAAPPGLDPAQLASAVLDEEAARQQAQDARAGDAVLPDDLLPGIGERAMPLREVIGAGGAGTVAVLGLINLTDEFDRVALAVLAPDIQDTLGVSDAVLGAVAGASGLLLVTGAVPLGYLADRVRRTGLVSVCASLFAVVVMLTGFVHSVWQLVVARVLSGFGKAHVLPVHNSLLSDAYPIAGRSRVFALHNLANPIGTVLGPAAAGIVAATAGGAEGWRWAFIVLGAPTLALAAASLFLREPRRGANEQLAVLGEKVATPDDHGVSLAAGFQRLKRIRTFYYLLVGVGVVGFALFSIPTFVNLLLEDRFGLDAWERGMVQSMQAVGGLVTIPLGGVLGDRYFRQSPPKVMVLIAVCLGAFGVLEVVGLYMPSLGLLVAVHALAAAFASLAFVPVNSLVAAIAPYRLRALAFSMLGIYIFLLGSFLGAVLTGALSDSFGERTALTIVLPPAALVGSLLIAYGARFVRRDISLAVEELREEQEERRRIASPGTDVPVLQVRNLDFSYGQVQVLFDVNLDVRRGETLALLGTNGAGKSTLLRAISGLAPPDRGAIRLHGRAITYTTAEERVRLGIVQVAGGRAVFGDLTVRENLLAGAYQYRWDNAAIRDRTAAALELFPRLAERLDQPAATLSGGEQQMVALAKALLLEPDVLLLDELSLGLAPVVVQELLGVVEVLKRRGITVVVVEQSLNVALSIADRAVFMEKGQVRFTGAAAELLERDDLARAVFLGGGR